MLIVRFIGKVYPLIASVNSEKTVSINWGAADLGFPLKVSARIQDSVIEVDCEVPRFEEAHIPTLLHRAKNLVDGFVDLLSFGSGCALRVELEVVMRPDGKTSNIFTNDPMLGSQCTAFTFPLKNTADMNDFEESLRIALGEPTILASLSDLAQVLREFNVTPTNCGRVLDSLRRGIAPHAKRAEGWRILREAINADSEYMEFISIYSTEPRHGDRTTPIPKEIINEIRKRTWNVMNRYLEYRKRGSVGLDPIKFPLLSHDPSFGFPKL